MARKDTIVARASGSGTAGVAVIRVSGPQGGACVEALTARPVPAARRAVVRDLRGADGEILDRGLVIWFPGPGSYTGEDVAEFHVHGGRAVVEGVVTALAARPGCRIAERGEFTRRAFDHGRMDLTAAEAVADLVAAETAAQRRQAVRLAGGAGAAVFEGWRERLLRAQARWEAVIDFSDEEIPPAVEREARALADGVRAEIETHLVRRGGERIRDGVRVAIIGAPNVGKSSLLNALARREAAIVSDTPGTTRDVIEVQMDMGGYAVTLVDTAGLRETADGVESEGVKRARAQAEGADVRVCMFDCAAWPELDAETLAWLDRSALAVVNKADLRDPGTAATVAGKAAVVVSVRDGTGMEGFVAKLGAVVAAHVDDGGEGIITRARHRQCLAECAGALRQFGIGGAVEMAAEDLRAAVAALGRLTGRVGVEDMLGHVFAEFCIGK